MANVPLRPMHGRASSKSVDNGGPQLTPEEYASAVSAYSVLRTGVGENHKGLAEFLESEAAFTVDIDESDQTKKAKHPIDDIFLTLYELGSVKKDTAGPSHVHHAAAASRDFRTYDEFEDLQLLPEEGAQGQLLFLRGYPTPRWLKLIGSKYKVDPEFFARHLDFLAPMGTSNNFSIPALPSSSGHLIQLHVTTLGSRDHERRVYKQKEIDSMRESDRKDMDAYCRELSAGSKFGPGNAFVRHYSTLDETHFAIEQRMSVYMHGRGASWSVFIWGDCGNHLSNSFNGPWSKNPGQTQLHPVINYRPGDGLKADVIDKQLYSSEGMSTRYVTRPQTAAVLHRNYGRTLRPDLMACDALYALHEVFLLSASSEAQFLNLVDAKLSGHLKDDSAQEFDSLPNLKFIKQILYRHIQQLHENIQAIRNSTTDPLWTKATGNETLQRAGRVATESILCDFNHNLEHAKRLDTRCQEAITILMSTTSIAESKKAMLQQERVGKLTFLAFLFVPLSFTTSFFGMNFKELNPADRSIWAWVVMSVPIVFFTLIAFFVQPERLVQPLKYVNRLPRV